jgi:hypothetical protein
MADLHPRAIDLGPPALLTPTGDEPGDLADGYIELERTERLAGRWVIQEHRNAVATWYLLLTHFRRALEGPTPRLDNALGARREILSLGLCSTKTALDATLAGYYSVALACIRHLTECWFNSRYLECHPSKWPGFYEHRPGQPRVHIPNPDKLIKEVIACNHALARSEQCKEMEKVWKTTSKGVHVTGEGMAQAASNMEGVFHVGPTFSLPLAVTTFSHGLFATERLTREALWVLRSESKDALQTANRLRDVVDDEMGELAKHHANSAPSM